MGNSELQNNAVGSANVINNSLTADDLAADSVGNSELQDNAVGLANMQNNSVGTNQVIDNSLTADDLATNSVGADELDADAVAQEVGTALLANANVVSGFADELAETEANASTLLGDLAANSNEAAQGSLASALGDNLVVSGGAGDGTSATNGNVTILDIANGSVVAEDLADHAVTTRSIADGAITTRTIANGAVTTRTIADGAVTNIKIAEGAVNSFSIQDYSIQGQDIADGAIGVRALSPELRNRLDGFGQDIQTAHEGVSMAFAMANIPQLTHGRDFSLGLGMGYFEGNTAFALGMNTRIEQNGVGRLSVSRSSNDNWGFGAGLSWEW